MALKGVKIVMAVKRCQEDRDGGQEVGQEVSG